MKNLKRRLLMQHRLPRSWKMMCLSLWQASRIERLNDHQALRYWGQASSQHLPSSLSCLVWNIGKGMHHASLGADIVKLSEQADLVLIQEALVTPVMRSMFDQPGWRAVHCASYRRRDGVHDGVLSLARAKELAAGVRVRSVGHEPVFKTPKVSLLSRYVLDNGSELLVMNVHALLIRSRRRAHLEAFRLAQWAHKHQGPVICAGDFNTFHDSYFRVIKHALRQAGLAHVPLKKDIRGRFGALDQIFVRGARIEQAQLLTQVRSSDHYPMLVSLEFAEASCSASVQNEGTLPERQGGHIDIRQDQPSTPQNRRAKSS